MLIGELQKTLGLENKVSKTKILSLIKRLANEYSKKVDKELDPNLKKIFRQGFEDTGNIEEDQEVRKLSKLLRLRLPIFASNLDKILELINNTGSQVETFTKKALEKVRNYFSKNFTKLDTDGMKKVFNLAQDLHLIEDEAEIYNLMKQLKGDKNKKVLIFDIDGTLRDADFGCQSHMAPNLDPKLVTALKKLAKDPQHEVYFVTTRSLGEIKASNVPYQSIPTFCENGRVKLYKGKEEALEFDTHPKLTEATEEMESTLKRYLKSNYPEVKTKFISIRGSVCFGIAGDSYTEAQRAIREDLKEIISNNKEWTELWSSGRFIGLKHKDFVSDKYAPLITIFNDHKSESRKKSFYVFGDSDTNPPN